MKPACTPANVLAPDELVLLGRFRLATPTQQNALLVHSHIAAGKPLTAAMRKPLKRLARLMVAAR